MLISPSATIAQHRPLHRTRLSSCRLRRYVPFKMKNLTQNRHDTMCTHFKIKALTQDQAKLTPAILSFKVAKAKIACKHSCAQQRWRSWLFKVRASICQPRACTYYRRACNQRGERVILSICRGGSPVIQMATICASASWTTHLDSLPVFM